MEKRRIYRVEETKKVAGVCGGIAEFLGMDVTIVRLIWALLTFFTAAVPGIIAYLICAAIIPTKSEL